MHTVTFSTLYCIVQFFHSNNILCIFSFCSYFIVNSYFFLSMLLDLQQWLLILLYTCCVCCLALKDLIGNKPIIKLLKKKKTTEQTNYKSIVALNSCYETTGHISVLVSQNSVLLSLRAMTISIAETACCTMTLETNTFS